MESESLKEGSCVIFQQFTEIKPPNSITQSNLCFDWGKGNNLYKSMFSMQKKKTKKKEEKAHSTSHFTTNISWAHNSTAAYCHRPMQWCCPHILYKLQLDNLGFEAHRHWQFTLGKTALT